MKGKWIGVLFILAFIAFVICLSLPYYISYSRNEIATPTGIDLALPLYSLVLVVPIGVLFQYRNIAICRIFMLILSFLLLIPVNFLQAILLDLEKYHYPEAVNYFGPGYYVHILMTILLFTGSLLLVLQYQKVESDPKEGLLD